MANPTCLPATGVTSTSGVINGNADNIPLTGFLRVSWSLVAGGPYNAGVNDAGTNTLDQSTALAVNPLTPGTTVYYVLQEVDTDGVTVLATSSECSFTTMTAPDVAFVPMPCTDCGSGSGGVIPPLFDTEQLLLCDLDADGNLLGTAMMVTTYSEETSLPTGPPAPFDPVTGLPYVVLGTLQPCPGAEQAPVFAGFVCDVFGGSPAVPAVAPTCPGTALGAPLSLGVGDGFAEGPAGTYTPVPGSPTLGWNRSPNDAQHAICSVRFVNDPGTGDDPFWQLGGSFVDLDGNPQNLIDPWISAIEAALGVGDVSDIPAGSTATASIGSTAVTITFEGPSPHSQMFAGNGAFFVREQDGDGLAAGVRLDFNPPIQSFQLFANVTTPSPGSISGLQEAQATPGTAAVPAQPAGVFEVKQFRNADGTSFYENLDGTPHPQLGAVGECGTFYQQVLCDSVGQFLRVYKITGGAVSAVQDYDLSGALYAASGGIQVCPTELATYRHTPAEVLCYTAADGVTVTQFLRRYLVEQDGVNVATIVDTLLDGTTPFVTVVGGTTAQCGETGQGCGATPLGTVCYTPPPGSVPSVPLSDDFTGSTKTGAAPGVITQTIPDYSGTGIPLVLTKTNSVAGAANTFAQLGLIAGTAHVTVDLGQPLMNVAVRVFAFDTSTAEQLRNVTPAFTAVTGDGTAVLANTGVDPTLPNPPAGTVVLQFAGPIQNIAFDYLHTGVAGVGIDLITADTIPVVGSQTVGTAAVTRDCVTGAVSYTDLTTGAAVDVSTVEFVDCGEQSCGTVLGTICYTPPPAVVISPGTHRGPDDWAGSTVVGANNGPQVITNANFAGAGITVKSTSNFGHGIIATNRIALAHAAATENLSLDLGAPRLNVSLVFNSFGPAGTEVADAFSPAFSSLSGAGVAGVGNTQISANSAAGTVTVNFAGPVQVINYNARTTAGQFALQSVEFDEIITTSNSQTVGSAAAVRDCSTGQITYTDLTTGDVVNLALVTVVDCEAAAPATLQAQARLLTNAAPWTPGVDVPAGTLTAITATGITGTWSVVDANGTVLAGLPAGLSLSWAASDDGTLTGPQSITPAVAGSVVAAWTVRP